MTRARFFEWLMVLSDFTVYYIVLLSLAVKGALNGGETFAEELGFTKITPPYSITFIYLFIYPIPQVLNRQGKTIHEMAKTVNKTKSTFDVWSRRSTRCARMISFPITDRSTGIIIFSSSCEGSEVSSECEGSRRTTPRNCISSGQAGGAANPSIFHSTSDLREIYTSRQIEN